MSRGLTQHLRSNMVMDLPNSLAFDLLEVVRFETLWDGSFVFSLNLLTSLLNLCLRPTSTKEQHVSEHVNQQRNLCIQLEVTNLICLCNT